jgi:glycosyltransferase involved in cell wall biosynthesis
MSRLTFAANNGDIGGGEVMLLRMAEAGRDAGLEVTVVGPRAPSELVEAARSSGLATVSIPADTRAGYMWGLRSWDRQHRTGHLWCNGLVPAVATAGRPRRVVHLHQLPVRAQRPAAVLARAGSVAVVVPSAFMAGRVGGARVLPNWTAAVDPRSQPEDVGAETPVRIGFLGRLSQDKGLDTLARAVGVLNSGTSGAVELRIAGDYRFVPHAQQDAVRRALALVAGSVTQLGWLDKETFFSDVDMVVFPSTWGEPFGLVAAEAMAAGVPLVVSDAGALPEVVGNDHPWVAHAGDPEDLARVIRSVISVDTTPTTENARRRWELEFSPDAGRRRYRRLLEELELVRT